MLEKAIIIMTAGNDHDPEGSSNDCATLTQIRRDIEKRVSTMPNALARNSRAICVIIEDWHTFLIHTADQTDLFHVQSPLMRPTVQTPLFSAVPVVLI